MQSSNNNPKRKNSATSISDRRLFRFHVILQLLKTGQYSSCDLIAERLKKIEPLVRMRISCGPNFVLREIRTLKNLFHAPIEFNSSEKKYYLTDPSWKLMGTDLEEIFRCCLKRQEENGKSRDHKRHSPVPFQQESYHPQKKIHGMNSVTGEEFDIECDSGVAPLIRSLNSHGVKTMFSCQGGIIPSGKRKLPYLVLEATSPDLLLQFAPDSPVERRSLGTHVAVEETVSHCLHGKGHVGRWSQMSPVVSGLAVIGCCGASRWISGSLRNLFVRRASLVSASLAVNL